jgi:hypothetical protein
MPLPSGKGILPKIIGASSRASLRNLPHALHGTVLPVYRTYYITILLVKCFFNFFFFFFIFFRKLRGF